MSSSQKKYPRTPLGKWALDLMCPFCAQPTADGLLDRNGMAYLSCRGCRSRCLSVGLRGVLSARFLGQLLKQPKIREAWALELARAEVELSTAPTDQVGQDKAVATTVES